MVKERAAQRAEDLAKSAEQVTQAARESRWRGPQPGARDHGARDPGSRGQDRPGAPRPRPSASGWPPRPSGRASRAPTPQPHAPSDRPPPGSTHHHRPGRRRQLLAGARRGDRRALRPVRLVVAVPHRSRLPGQLRHSDQGRGRRCGGVRRQQRRLGRQPRRDPARRRYDHDVVAHVVDGGQRRPVGQGRPGRSATSAAPVDPSGRTSTSSSTPSGSSTATSTGRSTRCRGCAPSASTSTEPSAAPPPLAVVAGRTSRRDRPRRRSVRAGPLPDAEGVHTPVRREPSDAARDRLCTTGWIHPTARRKSGF